MHGALPAFGPRFYAGIQAISEHTGVSFLGKPGETLIGNVLLKVANLADLKAVADYLNTYVTYTPDETSTAYAVGAIRGITTRIEVAS